jgi:cytochrome c peroxidase
VTARGRLKRHAEPISSNVAPDFRMSVTRTPQPQMPTLRSPVAGFALASLALLWALASVGSDSSSGADETSSPDLHRHAHWRNPVALVLADDARVAYVANRRAGSISVVDLKQREVLAEVPVAERLSDLVRVSERRLLATDEARGRLLLLDCAGAQVSVAAELDGLGEPVCVRPTDDGRRCCVTSLWSRTAFVIAIDAAEGQPKLRRVQTVPLTFNPRRMLWLPEERRFVLADAFGGRLAVLDPEAGRLDSVRELPAHNIGDLQLSADGGTLLVTHQFLNARSSTEFNNVHWGILMSNVVRTIPLTTLRDPAADLGRISPTVLLGEVGKAGADPAALALAPGGRWVVALSGVGGVSVLQAEQAIQYRIPAGVRPTALVMSPNGTRAIAADTLGDAVHVLDVNEGESLAVIPLGPLPELTAVDQGERLFYNARLSNDGWMSCHSCHIDGHSNGQVNDNFSDGTDGAPKRVLSLLGVGETGPWAWNGQTRELEEQLLKSTRDTMQGKGIAPEQAADLAAYLRTLRLPPAMLRTEDRDEAMERGRKVFEREGCSRCHAPPTYTSPGRFDVGLRDELGETRFNPPSLRGVAQRDRLFHDNRAAGLEDVLTQYRHQLDQELSNDDLRDLLRFLRSL